MKILLVEDDQPLAALLQKSLEQCQYKVDVANDGMEGWELAETFPYELILLDWMLPRLDGIRFCKQLRSGDRPRNQQPNYDTPILLMTAQDAVTNRIMGLDAGADDYLIKPLDLEELQARIRALVRRGGVQRAVVLEWEGLRLEPQSCLVTYREQPIALTLKEYQVLELLLRHPEQIFSQGRLIEHLWGQEETPTENAVRAQIKGLRQKLKQVGAETLVETIYKLGYRLRRGNPTVPSPSPAYSSPPCRSHPLRSPEMWQVWQECQASYFERLAVLEQSLQAIHLGRLTPTLKQQAEREAHTLVGSLGSFGLSEASRVARQIQQMLKQKNEWEPTEAIPLAPLISALRKAMEIETGPWEELSCPLLPRLTALPPLSATLLIVDDDRALAYLLAAEARSWGLQTAIATNLSHARQQIQAQQPGVVLLDLGLSESGENGLDLLTELQAHCPDLPVLVFTAQGELGDRVQAARLGCRGFLQKPITPSQVLAMVAQTLQQTQKKRSKLMVVDDDPQLLRLLRQVLEPEGYDLTLLEQPAQFWATLEKTAPDLLILDVELQGSAADADAPSALNGFDLCRVIRNDPQWGNLPILFLSGRTEPEVIQRGFKAGADDFLHKPIAPVDLLTRIRIRLEQGQLRRQMEIDELTGISNRRKALQDLTQLLRMAQRQQQPFSLAVLDLDHFKQINDQYGHETGDRVLHHLGALLRRVFRQEDAVGRWGGEEFVVGMYGTSKQDGARRLAEILGTFGQAVFSVRDGVTVQATFSGGIAQFLEDGQDLQMLYRAADAALYQAKAAGRNQISIAAQGGTGNG